MLKFVSSKVIKAKTQFVIVYDGIIPFGYSKCSKFRKRCDDEMLLYNNRSVLVDEYRDERGNKFYPEVGKVLTKSLRTHK